MKSWSVHYQNKYPGGRVFATEEAVDVYCAQGLYRVALRKNGAGGWTDRSQELGALDTHSLDPIPKDARAMKLYREGHIAPSEEHAARRGRAKSLAVDGKILSIEEYKSQGMTFEADGAIRSAPEVAQKAEAKK